MKKAMLKAERPTMSFGLEFKTEKEVKKVYKLLKKEGHVIRCLGKLPWSSLSADIVDKYGVCWYITVT